MGSNVIVPVRIINILMAQNTARYGSIKLNFVGFLFLFTFFNYV